MGQIVIDPLWRKSAMDMAEYVKNEINRWPTEAKQVFMIEISRVFRREIEALPKAKDGDE